MALGLTPHLPAFGGLAGGLEPRLTQALEACDLADRRLQPATTLSGGELARAMLARALIGDPQVLIADEPISGLDPWHALDTMGRLARLAGEGKLVVAAVHDLTLAARFLDAPAGLAAWPARGLRAQRRRAALTGDLVRTVFDVEARIGGAGPTAFVDYCRARLTAHARGRIAGASPRPTSASGSAIGAG